MSTPISDDEGGSSEPVTAYRPCGREHPPPVPDTSSVGLGQVRGRTGVVSETRTVDWRRYAGDPTLVRCRGGRRTCGGGVVIAPSVVGMDRDAEIDAYPGRYAATLTAFDARAAADLWATPGMIIDKNFAGVLGDRVDLTP
jgi:hypothetical protein